jgi:hypothetical protein
MRNVFVLFLLAVLCVLPIIVFAQQASHAGVIYLQVEQHGEAWYVVPETLERYYLQDGAAAYEALRSFGLGITNADLDKIPIGIENRFSVQDTDGDGLFDLLEESIGTSLINRDTDGDGYTDGEEIINGYEPLATGGARIMLDQAFADNLKGTILLQVEQHGEAWYVNPRDGKRYYLSDGDAAYQIMRYLSEGITDNDLAQFVVYEGQDVGSDVQETQGDQTEDDHINEADEGEPITEPEEEIADEEITYATQEIVESGFTQETPMALVVVDASLYTSLRDELVQYGEDIYRDHGLQMIVRTSWEESAIEIKEYITSVHGRFDLQSVLLVGDIAAPTMYSAFGTSQKPHRLADFVYQDVFGYCTYNESAQEFEGDGCDEMGHSLPPFVIGRLTPNSENELAELEEYFDRNHAYRTGTLSYEDTYLLYAPILSGYDQSYHEERYDSFQEQYAVAGISVADYTIIDILDGQGDAEYLSALAEPHSYVFYNGHGSPSAHEDHIYSSTDFESNAMIVHLGSCSVGYYEQEAYLAGRYLFNGNTLVVYAASEDIFSSPELDQNILHALLDGYGVAEAWHTSQSAYSVMNVLGDPLLSVQEYNTGGVLEISDASVMGVDGEMEFTMTNTSQEEIGLTYFQYMVALNANQEVNTISTSMSTEGMGSDFYDEITPFSIPAGETVEVSYRLNAIDEYASGQYEGKLFFASDHDSRLMYEIPFTLLK